MVNATRSAPLCCGRRASRTGDIYGNFSVADYIRRRRTLICGENRDVRASGFWRQKEQSEPRSPTLTRLSSVELSSSPAVEKPVADPAEPTLLSRIQTALDDDKAENIVTIDLEGRSALCDAAVIASGRSSRHVGAMAEHLARRLKESGYGTRPVTGQSQGDWVLVDAGDVIVHLFRPEVRDYYDLEGMWSVQ